MAKREKKPKKGSPAWMASFADLQQLLLVFFILLFSMSSVDENKFISAMASIQNALNTAGLGLTDLGVQPDSELVDIDKLNSIGELKNNQLTEELKEAVEFLENNELDGEPLSSYVTASKSDEGVILTIKDIILFDSGSADIKVKANELLEKLSPLLGDNARDVRVEGHTDNVPLKSTSKYDDNWELSTARATRVASFIINNKFVDASKISVAGYSEYRPVAKNDTLENKSKNRRVDIVLLSDFSEIEKKYDEKTNAEEKTDAKDETNTKNETDKNNKK